jgi:hypothetical protein
MRPLVIKNFFKAGTLLGSDEALMEGAADGTRRRPGAIARRVAKGSAIGDSSPTQRPDRRPRSVWRAETTVE